MSLDVVADVTSFNSLSFADMVCVQNQHLMPQEKPIHQLAHADKGSSEFEFVQATPRKSCSADISNGQLHEQAIALPPNQSPTAKQTKYRSIQ